MKLPGLGHYIHPWELTEMLPPDAHVKASNKVHISLTGFDVALNNFVQPFGSYSLVSVLNCKKLIFYTELKIKTKKQCKVWGSWYIEVFELNRMINKYIQLSWNTRNSLRFRKKFWFSISIPSEFLQQMPLAKGYEQDPCFFRPFWQRFIFKWKKNVLLIKNSSVNFNATSNK